jgi:hypothetical protein
MAAPPDDTFAVRDKVASFETYEDYLDSQITELDMHYLEDESLARQLIGESGTTVIVETQSLTRLRRAWVSRFR